jgi:hypothetical protein
VITLLAGFLIFIVAFVSAGAKHQWTQARKVIDQTIQESHAPNYHYIAQTERVIWGEAFHNDGAKLCECGTCVVKRTPPYMGKPNHVAIAAAYYGYGIMEPEEWRDREGE